MSTDPGTTRDHGEARAEDGQAPSVDGAAGVQVGSGNFQVNNYFYGNPATADSGGASAKAASEAAEFRFQGHAFISYVRQDAGEVDALQDMLGAAGIPVWRDTASLWPGEDWRARIRGAITHDALVFIACFSSHSAARQKSYQNEELLLAIDQLRLRRPDVPWLIPVRFDDCDVPDLELGAGRTLASIQWVDLFGPGRDLAARRLVEAVQRLLLPSAFIAGPPHAAGAENVAERNHTPISWPLLSGRSEPADAPTLVIDAAIDAAIEALAFSPDGSILASGGWHRNIKLWDVATGSNTATFTRPAGFRLMDNVQTLAFSPDGSMLASGGYANTVRLWDVATGRNIATLIGHTASIGARIFGMTGTLAFSPDGSTLLVGGSDDKVRLWDVATGSNTNTLTGHGATAISPDCCSVAYPVSQDKEKRVRLWDVATGRNTTTLTGHAGYVTAAAFSPDGSIFISGGYDRTVRLWDLATGRSIVTLTGHTDKVNAVAFSPDGSTVASGGDDRTVRLWDLATGRSIVTLTGHTDKVNVLAFNSDGVTLASGSADKTIRLWHIP